jgi:hemerythrin-like domain-containing protein
MGEALDRYVADPAGGFEGFAEAVKRFSAHEWPHMILETKVILPAAQKYLTAEDWSEIGKAWADHGDPRFTVDADEEFLQLFSRILNLAPEGMLGGTARA